ncbi:MAG: XRE family transcriptional regulator [Rhodobacteraceae bacterium]|nr:XRE family transcriptional regulator [Paracoccaceae bacterium]
MGQIPDKVVSALPVETQLVSRSCDDLPMPEVDGLRELRQLAGKAQAEIAAALNITQPSVSKIEKQTDMHLSTLRSYVEAVGGELELTVKLPKLPALRIHSLGDLTHVGMVSTRKKSGASSPRRRHG